MLSNRTDTRPGLAWQRVVARGYWDPDVYILFRCIIGPGIICMTIDFCTPLFAGWLLIQTHTLILGAHYSALEAAHVYHYANPSALLLCFVLDSVPTLVAAAQRWVERVKDSEFQVGEELQNHGEVGLDPGSVVDNGGEPSAGLDTMAHDHDHDALVEEGVMMNKMDTRGTITETEIAWAQIIEHPSWSSYNADGEDNDRRCI